MYAKKLRNELKALKKKPVDGFDVNVDESDILKWAVTIHGPPGTDFEGGIFQAALTFPKDYPFSPPALQFTSAFWHPNVYKDGRVCISILHTPDPTNPAEANHCWTPVQRVETILLSVISMLSDPNCSSPANVDASVEMRKNPAAYAARIKDCVEQSKAKASDEDRRLSRKYLKRMKSLTAASPSPDAETASSASTASTASTASSTKPPADDD
jgi:ubiquitin-protein ligase